MDFTESAEGSTLKPMAVHFVMGNYVTEAEVLATRESGAEARQDLARLFDDPGLQPDAVVAIDFEGVVVVSVPFADEFLGPLLSERLAGYYEDHPILAINANEDVRETIDVVLRQKRLHLLGISERGTPELLGGDDFLELTLSAALTAGTFNASQLARIMGTTPQAMNNRLKTLLRSGALRRTRVLPTRGGRQFEYQVPVPGTWHDENGNGDPRLSQRPRDTTPS